MKKSYKALGIFFKTEKQILREKTKKEIKKLIKTNKINDIDDTHGTALNRAIKLNDKKIITQLLENGADTIKSLLFLIETYKPITEIKQFLDFFLLDKLLYFSIEQLVVHSKNINDIKELISLFPDKKLINFVVINAIKNNRNLEDIKELIESSEVSDECLYEAVHQGRLDLVQYFIEEKNFDVNTTIDNHVHGGAILSIATMGELTNVIDYLLEKGAIPSQGVISAILKGNVEILKKLFECGAKVDNSYSEDLVGLLINAAIPANDPNYFENSGSKTKTEEDLSNYVETLKFLLENGGNPNAEFLERGKVVFIALFAYIAEPENTIYKDICKLLIQHGAVTPKLKKYQEPINKLMNDTNNSDEGYISDANIETKAETKVTTTTTSSRLEDTNFKSGIFHTFKTDQTSLNGEVKVFESEFFDS